MRKNNSLKSWCGNKFAHFTTSDVFQIIEKEGLKRTGDASLYAYNVDLSQLLGCYSAHPAKCLGEDTLVIVFEVKDLKDWVILPEECRYVGNQTFKNFEVLSFKEGLKLLGTTESHLNECVFNPRSLSPGWKKTLKEMGIDEY